MDRDTREYFEKAFATLRREQKEIERRRDEQFAKVFGQFDEVFARFDRLERALLRLGERVVNPGEVAGLQRILEIDRRVRAVPPPLGAEE